MRPVPRFTEIAYDSDLYRAELILRDEVLRKPIGLKLPERMEDEAACRHFGLVGEERLLACLIAVPLGPEGVRIRQMAVQPHLQGRGLGRKLMESAEQELVHSGIIHFMLHARDHAVGFYRKLGYASVGGPFTEVGIPHLCMEKRITQPARGA